MAGRPSNREERYHQVMRSLIRCVARFGLEGVSLAQVAQEAGLSRPSIRHHLGNREELLTALQDYVIESFANQTEELAAMLPQENPAGALIELLFSDQTDSSPQMILAFAALTARAGEDPELRQACRQSILEFETQVAAVLRRQAPEAGAQRLAIAAHGITAAYFNLTSLSALDMPEPWKATAKQVALGFLAELDPRYA